MNLSTQPYKGARDFYPKDKRIQKYMFSVLREVAESYGYQEYDAPILEPFEIYAAKSGEEIVNEQLYSFEDKGGRKVAIRPEMTPSVSRMVAARRQELAYPLRLYSIPNLWRYERPQRGRLREHWQLNVDLFGIEGIEGDSEIIQLADTILKNFGADNSMYEIRINSRKLLNEILDKAGFDTADKRLFLSIADKWDKFSGEDERAEYIRKQTEKIGYGVEKQRNYLKLFNNYHEHVNNVYAGKNGDYVRKLINILKTNDINVKFSAFLSRGFDYYTDIIFEVFDTDPENNRSMFGGGRYDSLVGMFGVEPVPTVGFGMGDVTLQNFLETHKLLPELEPETDATAIIIGDVYAKAQPMLNELREAGLKIAVDSSGRKLDAQIRSSVKSGVRHVIFIGDKEIQSGRYQLRDLKNGTEKDLSNKDMISEILRSRAG